MNRRVEIPAPKQPLVIVEREIPEPPANGAVVKIHFAGMCHSDVHLFEDETDMGGGKIERRSDDPTVTFPVVLGHEIAGEIHAFGKDVKPDEAGLHTGDLVMVYPWGGCRNCQMCHDLKFSRCPKYMDDCLGDQLPGGYEEYVAVPDLDRLIIVPEGLPMDIAALLPCSAITAYNAIRKTQESVEAHFASSGEASILIVGAGGVGLWGIQIARHLMPPGTKIIVAEAYESKFEDARKAGADETILWPINATVEANVAVCKELAPEGVSGAVDFVGCANTASSIFGCLAAMASMVLIGLHGGEMKLSIPSIIIMQNVVKGSLIGDPEHVKEVAQLVLQGKVTPPPITHVKLEEASRVLEDMQTGKSRGRNIIKLIK